MARPPWLRAVDGGHRAGGIGYGEVKALLSTTIEAHVAPMRDRYRRLLTDPAALDARLTTGEQHATQRADRTMVAMGL
jgi:tryptophanyl-tRNA synthetase